MVLYGFCFLPLSTNLRRSASLYPVRCPTALQWLTGSAKRTYRFLSYYEFFNFLDLGYMILVCLQLPFADPLVNPNQHFPGDILPIVHPCRDKSFYYQPGSEWSNMCCYFSAERIETWAVFVSSVKRNSNIAQDCRCFFFLLSSLCLVSKLKELMILWFYDPLDTKISRQFLLGVYHWRKKNNHSILPLSQYYPTLCS